MSNKEMKTKVFWKMKEETLVNLMVKIAKDEIKDVGKYDMGWYAGQLDLVRKIIANMPLEE